MEVRNYYVKQHISAIFASLRADSKLMEQVASVLVYSEPFELKGSALLPSAQFEH